MKLKKKLVLKALTDPKFRKMLQENPEAALNSEEMKEVMAGADVNEVLNTTELIDTVSKTIGPMIFCIDIGDPGTGIA